MGQDTSPSAKQAGDTTASVAAHVDAATAQRLARLLDEHFTTRVAARYGGADRDPPTRLVYLLDHEYTERGLSWASFKGCDADRAAALSAAAEMATCEAVLALAEIHETWQAYDEPEPYWHRGYGWNDDDEEEYSDGSTGEPQLQELIESTVHMNHWLCDPGSPASPTIDDDEVCATTPSVSLTPYSAEYEGYMGNYGNTADRWYRRAAIVVWPRRLAFAVRAEAAPEWALDALQAGPCKRPRRGPGGRRHPGTLLGQVGTRHTARRDADQGSSSGPRPG